MGNKIIEITKCNGGFIRVKRERGPFEFVEITQYNAGGIEKLFREFRDQTLGGE